MTSYGYGILLACALGLGLAGCGKSSDGAPSSSFVDACMKAPNPTSLGDDKRKAVCGCIETDALGKIADADVKKLFTDVSVQAMADPSKMQAVMTEQMTKVASDPTKLKAFQDGAAAYAAGASACAKKAM